jgi:cytochrome c peroxidase
VTRRVFVLLVLAACPRGKDGKTIEPAQKKDAGSHLLPPWDGSAASADLPPAPPLPEVPSGLPPIQPATYVTRESVALGELLFREPQLASDGKMACATCHDPAHGFSGGKTTTAAGEPNLRRASALVNLAWKKEFGWDGRYISLVDQLGAHIRGQQGDLAAAISRLESPQIRAQLDRIGGPPVETALGSLAGYVATRYEGDAPWDRVERNRRGSDADLDAGYQLFAGKAQCAVCHPPPLYTDLGYHRLGLIASRDEGRGRVDKSRSGAFQTPTLRGAAARTAFFHDGSALSLDAAIDWHLAGGTGQGADPSIVDPALKKITLSKAEREQLGAFVRALTRSP